METKVLREYCEDETFQARCKEDQVIVMETASYGRMSLGRCLLVDFGAMGCSMDVMAEFDALCSGRQTCDVPVRDLLVVEKRPCPRDLTKYLKAKYTCIHVMTPGGANCHTSAPPPIVTPSGYIASVMTAATLCGSFDSPWTIRALPGQRINVSIVTFNLHRSSTRPSPPICQVLSVIKEGINTKTVCRQSPRERPVYLSVTNEIEVRIVTSTKAKEKDKVHFLLRYQAVGCPDIEISHNSWFRRTPNGATYGCLHSGDSWALTCNGREWVGHRGKCENVSDPADFITNTMDGMSPGLSIIIIVVIASGIGILILLFGIACLRRKRRPETLGGRTVVAHQPRRTKNTDAHACAAQERPLPELATTVPSGADRSDFEDAFLAPTGENNYFRTWELPRHLTTGADYCRASSDSMPYTSPEEWDREQRYAEHVYDSPKSVRRHPDFRSNAPESVQYFELDPSVEVMAVAPR